MTLIVQDINDGTIKRIPEGPAMVESIQTAAWFNNISYQKAMKILKDGQELITFGYIRKLEET